MYHQEKLEEIASKSNASELINNAEILCKEIRQELLIDTKYRLNQLNELSEIILNETGADEASVFAASLFLCRQNDEPYVKDNFDAQTYRLYKGLCAVPEIKAEKTEKQSDNFIKLLLNITDDVRAVLILTALQLYKMRHYEDYKLEEQKRLLIIGKNIYIPLAHRTGLYNVYTELQEFLMKYSEREMYKTIAAKLKETKTKRDVYIQNFIAPLTKLLDDAGYNFSIKGRPKSIHSIWNKMKSKNVSFEEVYDLFAIRIILKSDIKNEKAVCWNVYSLITNIYKPNPKRLRDWISSPKLSGYESLHTTVLGPQNKWVEVQIRTERMDEIAEKGRASHFQYKAGSAGKETDWLSKIREAIENPEENQDDDFAKTSLYSNDILVFTPDNDLIKMKKGYTLLDFAFAIHSKVGEQCNGGIVNGKIQSLSYTLQNGDVIKILTNKNKKPNPEWLEIAQGQRTRNKIKRALKTVAFDAAEIGKELLKDKTERLKVPFNETSIRQIADYFNCKTAVELFHKVGKGAIDLQKIKPALEKNTKDDPVQEAEILDGNEFVDKEHTSDFLIIGDNLSGLDYKLANCCNPLPGDKVFGFVTVNKGTKIHKTTCPNAKEMHARYPYRIIKAKWNVHDENSAFSATIYISGTDKSGLSTEITKIIDAEFNMKLQAISLKSEVDARFKGLIVVYVNSRKQLNDLMKRLRMVKGVKMIREK